MINLGNLEIPVRIEGPWDKPNFSVKGQEQILEAVKEIGKNYQIEGRRGGAQGPVRRRRRPARSSRAISSRSFSRRTVAAHPPVPDSAGRVRNDAWEINCRRPAFPLHEGAIGLISRVSVRPAVHPDPWGGGLSVYWLGRGPMAYTDSLFQLGMDLTRSSTAQKEDHGQSAHRSARRQERLLHRTRWTSLRRHPSHHRPVRRQAA